MPGTTSRRPAGGAAASARRIFGRLRPTFMITAPALSATRRASSASGSGSAASGLVRAGRLFA